MENNQKKLFIEWRHNVCFADKAAIDYGGANGCFSKTAPAAKSAMGRFRNFAALRSKDSFGARF